MLTSEGFGDGVRCLAWCSLHSNGTHESDEAYYIAMTAEGLVREDEADALERLAVCLNTCCMACFLCCAAVQ